jgi:hypothetical protein
MELWQSSMLLVRNESPDLSFAFPVEVLRERDFVLEPRRLGHVQVMNIPLVPLVAVRGLLGSESGGISHGRPCDELAAGRNSEQPMIHPVSVNSSGWEVRHPATRTSWKNNK